MGFAAAGMRDIAVAADLSPANLYHYFSGKQEILYACQNLTLDRLQAAANAAARAKGPIAGRLRALAIDHVLCVIDQIQGLAVHFELDALPGAAEDGRGGEARPLRACGAGAGRGGHPARRARAGRSGGGDPRLPRRAELDRPVVSSRRCAAGRGDCLDDRGLRRRRIGEPPWREPRSRSPSTASRTTSRSSRTRRCSRCCVRT